jgi:quinol monooxygenase YgiN
LELAKNYMVVEYIRYKLADGLNAQFKADYSKAIEFLSASSVCHGYELTHCEEEPQRYILRIIWTST